jgi:hypothetical protein
MVEQDILLVYEDKNPFIPPNSQVIGEWPNSNES